jgi:hypothetical protein
VTSPARAWVAAAVGMTPYRVEYNATFWGDVLETRQQVSTEACATACTLWQRQGIPCAAWSWSPKGTRQKGACRLLSRLTVEDKKGPKGNVAGAIGEPASTNTFINTDANSHERACPNSPFAGNHTAAFHMVLHHAQFQHCEVTHMQPESRQALFQLLYGATQPHCMVRCCVLQVRHTTC